MGDFYGPGMAAAIIISTAFHCLELGHEVTRTTCRGRLEELVRLCAQRMGLASI